jgi:hypothetical protein
MSILNNETTKRIGAFGSAEILGDVYNYRLRQDKDNEFVFRGSTVTSKGNDGKEPIPRIITWDISKYDSLTITKPGATQEEGEIIKDIAKRLSIRILKAKRNKEFAKFFETVRGKNDADVTEKDDVKVEKKNTVKEEIAVTKELPKTMPPKKVGPSDAVRTFSKENGITSTLPALELAVKLLNELKAETKTVVRELTEEEIQQLVCDNIPSEYIEAVDKVASLEKEVTRLKLKIEGLTYDKEQLTIISRDLEEQRDALAHERDFLVNKEEAVTIEPEDPDDDPKGGQPIPAFNIADLKAELKTEILTELREELKTSLSTHVTAPKVVGLCKECLCELTAKHTTEEYPNIYDCPECSYPNTLGDMYHEKEEVKEPKAEVKTKVKVKLPVAKEVSIAKNEEKKEIKKEEIVAKPKSKKISELTLDDIKAMDYQKLQKLGSAIKLGAANVAGKDELLNRIAIKLKLVKPAKQTKEVIVNDDSVVESLKITKHISKHSSSRAANDSYTGDDDSMYEISAEEEALFNEPEAPKEETLDEKLNKKYDDPAMQSFADTLLKLRRK